MKTPGLPATLLVATLFLATGLHTRAQPPPMDAKGGGMRPANDRVAEMLKRFDTNGDGKIDEEERVNARDAMVSDETNRQAARAAAVPGGLVRYRARVLELFDQNREGRLDEEERIEARRYAEERGVSDGDEVREEVFKRFDKNGDGQLDETERADLQAFQERRAEIFAALRAGPLKQADANQDGKFDATEMTNFEAAVYTRIERDPTVFFGADRNGDGRFDYAEWVAVRDQLRRVLAVERADIKPEDQAALDRKMEEGLRRRDKQQKEAGPGAGGPGVK